MHHNINYFILLAGGTSSRPKTRSYEGWLQLPAFGYWRSTNHCHIWVQQVLQVQQHLSQQSGATENEIPAASECRCVLSNCEALNKISLYSFSRLKEEVGDSGHCTIFLKDHSCAFMLAKLWLNKREMRYVLAFTKPPENKNLPLRINIRLS